MVDITENSHFKIAVDTHSSHKTVAPFLFPDYRDVNAPTVLRVRLHLPSLKCRCKTTTNLVYVAMFL